jgi:hypothetical protein
MYADEDDEILCISGASYGSSYSYVADTDMVSVLGQLLLVCGLNPIPKDNILFIVAGSVTVIFVDVPVVNIQDAGTLEISLNTAL